MGTIQDLKMAAIRGLPPADTPRKRPEPVVVKVHIQLVLLAGLHHGGALGELLLEASG
jgi:hypothetical protein